VGNKRKCGVDNTARPQRTERKMPKQRRADERVKTLDQKGNNRTALRIIRLDDRGFNKK
jgi:hypothetical protein